MGAVSTEPTGGPGEARAYDFINDLHVARGRMPALEMINERFARLFHQSLYNLLRRSPEISVSQVIMKKFNDYVNTLHMPTNLNIVRINPLRGMGLVVMDPKLVFTAVDKPVRRRGAAMRRSKDAISPPPNSASCSCSCAMPLPT